MKRACAHNKKERATAPFFSSGRKETAECAIIRARRPRHRRRRLRRCRYCRPARYDNFTFIDRSGRTTLYLPLHPRTLSFRSRPSFALRRARAGVFLLFPPRSRSLFTVLVVQGRYRGVRASSKLKRSCTLGIRGLACTYIIRRKLRRAM